MPERNCGTCTAKQKKEWGCTAHQVVQPDGSLKWVNRAKRSVQFDNQTWWQCPKRIWLDEPEIWGFVLDLFAHYRNGFLPEAGGINNQPYLLMRVLALVSVVWEECEDQVSKDKQRKAEIQRQLETETKGRR